ncbi:MAG: aminotransferase class I/II-fold pyridoxal phosphate-dependent enzyme [Planctomycetota bacterium]|nr:aminotransferase class I/II-fold pyridoxal phosphate-dependent enzyme [Planctomycetota bacterium]
MTSTNDRIYLSPPEVGAKERELLLDAFDSNWIAPLGPHVDQFEKEFGDYTGASNSLALSSGTAGLHLALLLSGVKPGDKVLCSTFTFAASANAIMYCGADPIFIDSDEVSWNMCPSLLAEELEKCSANNSLPKALVLVHIFGQSADINPISNLCDQYGVALIEDAAESLGATYKGKHTGTIGKFGVYSFNGNKIMTTSGGGMLVSSDADAIERAKFLSTQAREPKPHYQHEVVGYNYRLSNLLAAVGRGQLFDIESKVSRRRQIFDAYQSQLGGIDGIGFMPEADFGRSNRWLSVITIDELELGLSSNQLRLKLEEHNIESRPVWKPMHLQPVFKDCRIVGGSVSELIFEQGLCLPSGTSLTPEDQQRIVGIIADAV